MRFRVTSTCLRWSIPGPGTLGRAMGTRAVGWLGCVPRSPAILWLPAARADGGDCAARGCAKRAHDHLYRDVDRDRTVPRSEWQPARHRGCWGHGVDSLDPGPATPAH